MVKANFLKYFSNSVTIQNEMTSSRMLPCAAVYESAPPRGNCNPPDNKDAAGWGLRRGVSLVSEEAVSVAMSGPRIPQT